MAEGLHVSFVKQTFFQVLVIPLKTTFIIFLNGIEKFCEVSSVFLSVSKKKMQLHIKACSWPNRMKHSKQRVLQLFCFYIFFFLVSKGEIC